MRGESILKSLFGEQKYLRAVDEVTFEIREGEILGLAGQSGSGKSTLGDLLLHLETPTDGAIHFKGDNILDFSRDEMKNYRQNCQIVFQDPYESLNPRIPVGRLVSEPLVIHGIGSKEERSARTLRAIEDAGLTPPGSFVEKLPRELSGGERQRVSIARAMVLDPDFLVADEPVSMLDVSVRSGILNLFKELQEKRDLTMVYISHDLTTINYLADRTMIMYLGNLVEIGETRDIIHNSAHPYTETLLKAIPTTDLDDQRAGSEMKGKELDPAGLPAGCRFRPNCQYATDRCAESEPPIDEFSQQDHKTACYHPVNQ